MESHEVFSPLDVSDPQRRKSMISLSSRSSERTLYTLNPSEFGPERAQATNNVDIRQTRTPSNSSNFVTRYFVDLHDQFFPVIPLRRSDSMEKIVDPPTPVEMTSKGSWTSGSENTSAETSRQSSSTPTETPPKPTWRFYAAFGCLCLVNLVAALDATSLSVALPIIANKLHGSAIEAFWAGTSFLLTSTVFQPSWASFSHIFGRKPMLLLALAFFTVGAIIGAVANNFATLLVGRSIQGVGGGGIVALTYVIVTDMVTLKERGKWFGLISMTWAIGSVSGPVIGGAFAEKASWRWIFWINLPFCGVAFVAIPLFLRFNYTVGSIFEKLKRVDWIGSCIFVASTTAFLIPITWGGIQYSWTHWRTLTPLILGVFGLLAFVLYSKLTPLDPLIRGSIFKSRTALVSYFGTVIHGTILWSMLYYLPLYYEAAKDLSPILSGVALFPQTFTVAPASVIVGVAITITGRYRWAIWSGWILTTLGVGLLILLETNTPTVKWIFLNLVSGMGLGILYPAMSFSIQASASNADLPFAAAMFSFFRAFGQAIGVAVGGSVFQNSMKRNLQTYAALRPKADEFSKDASALVTYIKQMGPGEVKQKAEIIQAYVGALRTVWIVMCALAAFTLFLSCVFTQGLSLDRELETDQGFRDGVKKKQQQGNDAEI
ncbi:MAG: hypothetical protein M1836_001738 [Candelina mexicana]|nr:MAG: hypothetical protein M1836_001738 [Candelina mexicana]